MQNAGLLKISGIDAKKLLQGQLTCDVEKATSSAAVFGAHCNPQGRILSLFYLWMQADAYYLFMPRNMVAIAHQALKKYAVFYKLTLEDVSDSMTVYGYQQPASTRVALPAPATRAIALQEEGDSLTDAAWKLANLQEGIPTLSPETSGKFLPHEINLPALSAIAFDKGCYTGQEIIARMQYRGKLKKKMCLAHITSATVPMLGADIYKDQQMVGHLVAYQEQAPQHYLVLIIIETAMLTETNFSWDEANHHAAHIHIQNETTT